MYTAHGELLLDPQAWIAFLTLTALELVLGIDNIVFISILVDRLPAQRRERLVEAVRNLEKVDDVSRIGDLLH